MRQTRSTAKLSPRCVARRRARDTPVKNRTKDAPDIQLYGYHYLKQRSPDPIGDGRKSLRDGVRIGLNRDPMINTDHLAAHAAA